MVLRGYPQPHRFICVTDDWQGIDPDIEIVPLWTEFADIPNPHGPKNPSCYRRLKMFDPDIERVFGKRFVSLDLDCVVTGDLTPLWDRPEDIVLYGNTNPQTTYNGSMLLLTAGSRPDVWTLFDPIRSPQQTFAAQQFGSDQGWISLILGRHEAIWTKADGVYSFRNDLRRDPGNLPEDCRVAIFHGRFDPWSPEIQKLAWVKTHYR